MYVVVVYGGAILVNKSILPLNEFSSFRFGDGAFKPVFAKETDVYSLEFVGGTRKFQQWEC